MAVDENIKKKANDIRTKIHGLDVRESLAKGLEDISEDVVQNIFRQDSVEAQFNKIQSATTNRDFTSAPEILAAHVDSANVSHPNLKARLDHHENETRTKLGTKADQASTMSQADFDSWVATLLGGGPSIFMETLATLKATYPNGSVGVALVRETNPPKVYVWRNSDWDYFGDYTGLIPNDKTITAEKLGIDVLTEITANNLHAPDYMPDGYINKDGVFVASSRHKSGNQISAREGDWFYFDTGSGQYTLHDRYGNYLQGFDVATPNAVQVPQNIFVRYIRFVVDTQHANPVVTRGKYRNAYELTEKVMEKKPEKPIVPTQIQHVEIVHQANIIDWEAFEVMAYYDALTGERKQSWLISSTEIKPCKGGDSIFRDKLGSGQVSYWDINGDYVTGIDSADQIIKVPNNPAIVGFRANLTIDSIRDKTAWISMSDKPIRTRYKFPKEHFDFEADSAPAAKHSFIKPYHGVINPIITPAMVTDRTGVTGVADPFIVEEDGTLHAFFEVLSATGDEIGHAHSEDARVWTYTGIIMSIAQYGHRSAYPHVFKVDGEYYMTPDTGWQINLYKATNFPTQWERIVDYMLPNTGYYNDSNIFPVAGNWYMTTSYNGTGVQLYKNTTTDFKNDQWQLISTIIENDSFEGGMRGAGNPAVYDGYVMLPIQVSPAGGVYGQYTYLYKLSGFKSGNIKVANLGKLTDKQGDGGWADGAMHHASHTEFMGKKLFAVDGWKAPNVYTIGLYIEA